MSLRLPYYFWLGCRGFAAAFAWLVVPVTLLAARPLEAAEAAPLLGVMGAVLLGLVLMYLPFLQVRHGGDEPLRARRSTCSRCRRDFRKAPWAFAFAFVVTLLFALPLYLLKIE